MPQALACFFEGDCYEDVIRNCVSIGGDSDTIAAIAGGIAEAYFYVPNEVKERVWDFLPNDLASICKEFDSWRDKSPHMLEISCPKGW